MKTTFYAFSIACALLTASTWAAPFSIDITSDHTNCLYHCGETATFTVTVTETNGAPARAGSVEMRLSNCGPKTLQQAQWDLAQTNVFTVSGTLTEPGFLSLNVKGKDGDFKDWGVGYEPEKIAKGSPMPADFDAFWAEARTKLAKEVPLDAKTTRIPELCTKDYDFFRISFATFGRRVYGYMTVPTAKTQTRWPVDFEVCAAGFGNWTNELRGRKDSICVKMGVYPFEPDWRWKEMNLKTKYDALNAAAKKDWGVDIYACAGISKSREDYFFYPVLLGIDRVVDWVASRPDVDLTHFRYYGTSQGGGFGFYLTGLNSHFTRAVFWVPAITDTMGYLKGRNSGWPRITESQPSPEAKAEAAQNAPYFDAANFASRITCPVRVAVGFSDTTCPPCAVYAAFNEIRSADKAIMNNPGMPHNVFWPTTLKLGRWLREGEWN